MSTSLFPLNPLENPWLSLEADLRITSFMKPSLTTPYRVSSPPPCLHDTQHRPPNPEEIMPCHGVASVFPQTLRSMGCSVLSVWHGPQRPQGMLT